MTSTSSNHPIQGSLVALITPMLPDGSLDLPTYRKLIDWHIEQGTNGLVVVGTTGESPTVSMEENSELIRIAVEHTAGRVPVIAGAGANSTAEAVELSKGANDVGADAILSVVPYYNRPTQEGMYQHFRTIAEAVDIPVILYNVPGRTMADLLNPTALRLAQIDNITGIKDATGDIGRGVELIRQAPDGFSVYSGDDATAAALILLGGKGNISVTANVAPRLISEMCAAALAGDVRRTREINELLSPLNRVLFVEGNPIPVKWAMAQLGLTALGYRLPLVELSQQYHVAVLDALAAAGISKHA
jgi:4-hydroxy-tetrahydrodipicolinate synthase